MRLEGASREKREREERERREGNRNYVADQCDYEGKGKKYQRTEETIDIGQN